MTRSTDPHALEARRAYERLLRVTNPDRVRAAIDTPIDRAVRRFTFRWQQFSTRAFHAVVADFVAELSRDSLPVLEQSPRRHDVALSLLDTCYEGPCGRGYGEALLDAAGDPKSGIATVLVRFAEGLKQHQQQRFLTAMVHRELSVLSPSTRLALAHFVLQCAEGESSGAQASVSHVLQRLPAAVMGLLQGGGPLRQILQRPYFR